MKTKLFFSVLAILSCLSFASCNDKDSKGRPSLNKYLTFDYDIETDGYAVGYNGERTSSMFTVHSVEIPEEYKGDHGTKPVTKIKNNAFKNTKTLGYVTFPDSIIEIGDSAFDWCPVDVQHWPSELVKIGDNAFAHTSNYEVILPDKVESIGAEAFRSTKTHTLVLSKSVKSIGYGAFSFDSDLKSIEVDVDNPVLESRHCNCVIEKETNKLILGCRTTSIPNDIYGIGKSAFNGIKGVKAEAYLTNHPVYYIPINVEYIETNSFINFDILLIDCEAESQPMGWQSNWYNNNDKTEISFGIPRH